MGVFVLDSSHKPLNPCHPGKARKLLNKGEMNIDSTSSSFIRIYRFFATEPFFFW